MHERYIAERICNKKIAADNSHLQIESVDSIIITLQSPTGSKKIKLSNVHYVPDFLTNLVSASLLADKELYFDTQHKHLHINGVTKYYALRHDQHYLLENNKTSTTTLLASEEAFFMNKEVVKIGLTEKWHKILAHAGNDAIQHLADAVKGVKVNNKDNILRTNKCETCALFKGYHIVLKSSYIKEVQNKPFYRISYDLIELNSDLNKDK